MNQKYLILVEGKADRKFIKDYIKYHYGNRNIIIEINNGKDFNLKKIANIQKYIDDNYKLIVIFDADNDINKSIDNIKINLKNYNLDDKDIFLFPNNKDSGSLEDLLINIAVRKEIINCFDNYVTCIKSLENTNVPINKSKVYAYLDSINGYDKNRIKEEERDYTNKEIWDIYNDFLNPLKEFFNQYFTIL